MPLKCRTKFIFLTGQLSFNKNDIITILERKESGWWRGELNGQSGLFPSNYIETAEEDSDEEDEAQNGTSAMSAVLEEVVALYPYKASGTCIAPVRIMRPHN